MAVATYKEICGRDIECMHALKVIEPRNKEIKAMNLAWENLTVELPKMGNGSTKKLLTELTGYAEPGRIMAIMGPSGSGKSTLLDSLAGIYPFLVVNQNSGKIIISYCFSFLES